ncbi:hypothetical protein PCCS19_12790 [Paenibacillus sp. CCS19]|uniref:hypothetical protein n=1 Tax=Paenibacillus sp. CCS19 TaxID=3158387 RepID=UPI00255FC345|nr:hypothetical protein [Paenibacillus cellulosilyticus]GMK38225.1 hypothetical protein PCCS19_12790 [Paenibacillus cellulosilyticus]
MAKQSKWAYSMKAGAALLLAASILSACGSKDDASGATANGGQAASQQQGPNGQGGFRQMATAPNQPERQADLFAKVVSIDGTSVVVKQADMSAMPQRGQGGGGQGQGTGQDGGNFQPPADGEMPQGDFQPPADGQAPQGNGQGMPDFFTGEESTISIADGTSIYKLVRGDDGSMNYEQVKLADLAADDIINVWLKSGTKEAEYVSLSGGFGGGFGGGGMRGYGNRQNGGDQANGNTQANTQTGN